MAVRAAFDALALAFMAPAQEQAELHVEELFKGQLAPGLFPFLHRIREMYLLIGFERRHGGKGD